MSERRQELIGKALDYMLAHGVAGLTLRPLAGAIGTSARLLVYHFGSKDGLITAVMDEVRARAQRSFAEAVAGPGKGTGKGVMRTFWDWTVHPANVGYMRLLFEVQVLALRDPATYGPYLEGTSRSWLGLIETSLPPSRSNRAVATLCTAVIDGLLLEYLSTGDGRRTTRALEYFGRLMTGAAPDCGSSRRKPATGRIGASGRAGRRERGRT
ncbi:MAG: TetR/AcrR family transcriptional regulator [Thermoanaerobaculaceae bacterium]|nr:TetR/AcrR family transcriptional regulator [Thermoanaerobaculaceae bacterium]